MAYHDPLTGLANRNKLEQFVSQILAQSRRHQESFALMFIDLDRFKNINDTIGHEAGDLLLQIIADRLKGAIRNTDLVARLGGDEFVIVVTDVHKSESVAVIAHKILESVMQAFVIKGQEIYITTSIGISLYPFDGQNMQTLMKNADLALYRAKEHGKNNYQFYTMEMTSSAQARMTLQNALAHALMKEEFLLNYQPKMELKSRKITGVEAFLRWKNKEFGMITPGEIIELAEETGLIIPVSDWILKTACKELKQWQQLGFSNLTVAVNCSARQFKQANVTNDVLRILTETGITPQSLELEVTEKIIMNDPENILRSLYALKDLGVKIAIDDFGTGYWSLNNLRRLSVDKIKIDKTFIKQMLLDETSSDIVSAIIAMVTKLGIKSVAEGVETREQYDFLLREGCTEIQGYYLTQPLSDEAMSLYLKHPIPDAEVVKSSKDKGVPA
jgi:diguanylate cyclase (GGDEF)-like protein